MMQARHIPDNLYHHRDSEEKLCDKEIRGNMILAWKMTLITLVTYDDIRLAPISQTRDDDDILSPAT